MQAFFDAIFSLVNLPYTILMALIVTYWLTVLVGLLDVESFDLDLDADVDVDVDMDVDVDADADVGAGWLAETLGYFNIGEVPFMVYLSVAVLSMWTCSFFLNQYTGNHSYWLAAGFAIPNLLVGMYVAKIVTAPLKVIYEKLDNEAFDHLDVVGQTCRICSGHADAVFGQAEVVIDGSHMLIAVRTSDKEHLVKGDEAVVIEYHGEQSTYLVTSFEREA